MAEGLLQLGHSGTAPLGSLRAADPPMRGSLSFEEWRLQDKHSRGPGVCGLPPTLPSFLSVFPSLPFLFYSLLSMFCVCVLGTFNEALTKTPIDLFYTPHVTDTKRWGGVFLRSFSPGDGSCSWGGRKNEPSTGRCHGADTTPGSPSIMGWQGDTRGPSGPITPL